LTDSSDIIQRTGKVKMRLREDAEIILGFEETLRRKPSAQNCKGRISNDKEEEASFWRLKMRLLLFGN
jgi:hypothetical protein